ncbi:uncharacterized protein FTJAE_10799 [Fusarium tjaetaba]|uniref:Uncharacterized protein n=1 Tax=Fusarium tjaetaba TaxID=1567544 RepID=A0A8H5VHX7_9HYPO|nr:uncharacterized protein FTJAE_10799 [Fusarium tjaetaba]KAF5622820.1 hypothetical protein FTJAE_10799 [Fusarium tjaetaba]
MNNQARGNSRRGQFRRGRGQYFIGNMGHPQNGGFPGQAPVPFPPPPPPPPVVAYPAYGQVPYAMPPQPYIYPPYAPVMYQNSVPPGYYPYANPVPAYVPPPPQGQVYQAAQAPGQYHGPSLSRRHRGRVQARGRVNGRGRRGQPNRRQVGRENSSARQAAQVAQERLPEAGVAQRNSLAALPVPFEQNSDLDSRGVKQEDTEDQSTRVAQNIGFTEIKREPVIKQEPQ